MRLQVCNNKNMTSKRHTKWDFNPAEPQECLQGFARRDEKEPVAHSPGQRGCLSHQGKRFFMPHLSNKHDFGGWVAIWQVWHDSQVQAVRGVWGGLGALLWLGVRGGLMGSTSSKNEVSGQFCVPVLSDLRLFDDVGNFVAVLRCTDCFECRSDNTGTIR